MIEPILAASAVLRGEGIFRAVIVLFVLGVVFWVLFWLSNALPLAEPWKTVARAILYLAGAIIVINFLLGLIGHAFISW